MYEIAIIASLVILLLGSQFFWMRHTQVLVNKLMSRNYTEYSQNENMLSKKKEKVNKVKLPPNMPDELGIMGDFN
jgi:hypothetical protein